MLCRGLLTFVDRGSGGVVRGRSARSKSSMNPPFTIYLGDVSADGGGSMEKSNTSACRRSGKVASAVSITSVSLRSLV